MVVVVTDGTADGADCDAVGSDGGTIVDILCGRVGGVDDFDKVGVIYGTDPEGGMRRE